jgi:hypothetical protein
LEGIARLYVQIYTQLGLWDYAEVVNIGYNEP